MCSFHVGSGVEEAEAFSAAVETAAQVFDEGQALGFDFDLLDIGGGFPGHSGAPITFEEVEMADYPKKLKADDCFLKFDPISQSQRSVFLA